MRVHGCWMFCPVKHCPFFSSIFPNLTSLSELRISKAFHILLSYSSLLFKVIHKMFLSIVYCSKNVKKITLCYFKRRRIILFLCVLSVYANFLYLTSFQTCPNSQNFYILLTLLIYVSIFLQSIFLRIRKNITLAKKLNFFLDFLPNFDFFGSLQVFNY